MRKRKTGHKEPNKVTRILEIGRQFEDEIVIAKKLVNCNRGFLSVTKEIGDELDVPCFKQFFGTYLGLKNDEKGKFRITIERI